VTGRALAVGGLVALGALLLSAGGPRYWLAVSRGDREPVDPDARFELAGGDGASMPTAAPGDEGLEPAALDAAAASASAVHASALLVARRGHRVFERVEGQPQRRVRSALLSRLVFDASAATMSAEAVSTLDRAISSCYADRNSGSVRNPWSARSRRRFGAACLPDGFDAAAWARSQPASLWQSLAAGPAIYERDGDGVPRVSCCLWLRPRDALALATAVFSGGQVAGEHLFAPEAAARILDVLEDRDPPRGAEPFGSRAVRLLRDDEGTRLYFFPAQDIVILLVGADEARLADETALAHQVLRGVIDRPLPPASSGPRNLVPAH